MQKVRVVGRHSTDVAFVTRCHFFGAHKRSQQERTRYLRQVEGLEQDSAPYIRQLKRMQREIDEWQEEIGQLSSENIILAQSVLSPKKRVLAA